MPRRSRARVGEAQVRRRALVLTASSTNVPVGLNYGTELMAIAERAALGRGCTRAFLETYSFQALPFYEKCGYNVASRLPDFPPGGARYGLTKDLSGTA
jgi:hypothetical protein